MKSTGSSSDARVPYNFSILRYIHVDDAPKIDGERFRQMTRYIEQELNAIGVRRAGGELPFVEMTAGAESRPIELLLARVLPQDDSSIQFSSPAGVGLSLDLEKTLAELFER